MIKIVKGLDITKDGIAVFNRKWQSIHLRQGEMDGACAVYSLMMNLMILKVLTRTQITNLNTTFKGNTAKGRLYKEFFITEGLCRDGFYFTEIRDKLSHSFAKIVKSHTEKYSNAQAEQGKYVENVKCCINQELPLMTAISFRGGTHAILAIGYEEIDGNLTKIFCLDPDFAINNSSYWNAVIRINDSTNKVFGHSYITDKWCTDVCISESLKIVRK